MRQRRETTAERLGRRAPQEPDNGHSPFLASNRRRCKRHGHAKDKAESHSIAFSTGVAEQMECSPLGDRIDLYFLRSGPTLATKGDLCRDCSISEFSGISAFFVTACRSSCLLPRRRGRFWPIWPSLASLIGASGCANYSGKFPMIRAARCDGAYPRSARSSAEAPSAWKPTGMRSLLRSTESIWISPASELFVETTWALGRRLISRKWRHCIAAGSCRICHCSVAPISRLGGLPSRTRSSSEGFAFSRS